MPCSMTGFARHEAQFPWGTLSCEIRSVNHRYLEPTLRLPEVMRVLEPKLRETLRKTLSRGKIEVALFLKTDLNDNTEVELNSDLANKISSLAETLSKQLQKSSDINPMDILKWPGVIQAAEIDVDALRQAAQQVFKAALDMLVEHRKREGEDLRGFIDQRLQGISQQVELVRKSLPKILEQYREKLHARLESLSVEVDEDRFAQEVVYVTQKADVAEELDRLETHLSEVTRTINDSGPIGRRLDFLMQELNREANTLSSKSMASETTQAAVETKVLIEQMREQVQNIE